MAKLVLDALNYSRRIFGDPLKTRKSDNDLLKYFNEGLLDMRSQHPDIFVGQFAAFPSDRVLNDAVPFEDQFLPTMANYIASRVEGESDAEASQVKSAKLMDAYRKR